MNSRTSTHRKSLGEIALVVVLFGLGVAFDGDATSTAAPASPTRVPPTPAQTCSDELPEPKHQPLVDIENLGPDEEVAILWAEHGCFNSYLLDIRLSGSRPGIALVSKLRYPNGSESEQVEVEREINPKTVIRTLKIPINQEEAAGVTEWLERLRGEEFGGCTTVVNLSLLRTSTRGGEVVEVREQLTDDTCEFRCKWVEGMLPKVLNSSLGVLPSAQP